LNTFQGTVKVHSFQYDDEYAFLGATTISEKGKALPILIRINSDDFAIFRKENKDLTIPFLAQINGEKIKPVSIN
jgi:hypothetical protein